MSKLSKIVVTVVIVIVWMLINAVLVESHMGVIALILAVGAFAGIRAIWKKDKNDGDNNTSVLQK